MTDIEQLAKKGELFDGRYKLLRTLSTEGGTADVWLAIDVNTRDNPQLLDEQAVAADGEESGMLVAIKIYRPKNALDIEGEQRFRDEYKIVHNCRHTNLLQPTNFSICNDTPYLELPYCKNGSSELLIGRELSDKDIWKFIYDVSSGLSYLHACNPSIIHQDIKPANVLIDDYHNYAITDFGISSQRGGKHSYYVDEENSGTMAYMAPERFRDNYKPIAESDIWAFGATLYEILTGNVPYGEEGGKNQLENKVPLKPMSGKISKDIQKLILSCLALNPKDRPTANQIILLADRHLHSRGSLLKYVSILVVVTAACFALYRFMKPEPVVLSQSEAYTRALTLLDGEEPEDVAAGLNVMDSLANTEYVPAIYEMARTYGWYSDSISLKRKRKLGIGYYTEGDSKYMPVSDKYNDKARELFSKIIEIETSDPILKANAAYRLATYCNNKNSAYGQNFKKAKQYLLESKKYALEGNDTALLKTIDTFIDSIDAYTRTLDNN